ncbi:MAG: GntR family transcriptional regulator [Victivallales bacterium]|nr:GntR family transcriptional regulator [Victivallales bacterium]
MAIDSKYTAIAEEIRRDIFRTRFGRRLPNNVELADCYKSSPVTIRKALNFLQKEGIVEVKTTSAGTVVSDDVLSRRKMRTVAMVTDKYYTILENVHFQKLFASVQGFLAQDGSYHAQIEGIPVQLSDRIKYIERLKDMFAKGFYSGTIAISSAFSAEELRSLLETGMPIVLVGRPPKGFEAVPFVRHDDDALASMILEAVGSANASRVGILTPPFSDIAKSVFEKTSIGQVMNGLRAGDLFDDEDIRFIEFGHDQIERAVDLTSVLLAESPDLDFLVSFGTNISRGAMFALKTAFSSSGNKICLLPITDEDVVGDFPNLLLPVDEIGKRAADIILGLIEDPARVSTQPDLCAPYWVNHPDFKGRQPMKEGKGRIVRTEATLAC